MVVPDRVPPPPRLARLIASRGVPPAAREFLLGDLEEQYAIRVAQSGAGAARIWYWRQALAAIRHAHRPRPQGTPTARGDFFMRHLMTDVRFAIRLLARQRSYTLVAVLSLALAIGANGLVYGLVDNLVLHPFPFPDADRLVSVGSTFPKLEGEEGFIEQHSTLEVEDFRRARSLTQVTAFDLGNRAVSNGSDANRVFTALVLDDPFPALGLPPHLGRGFTREELAPGGPNVAIISHRLWTSLYGSDPAIVNRVIQVNGVPRTVVGVMADGPSLIGTDLWIPWGGDPLKMPRNGRQFTVVARLAPGASLSDASVEMGVIAARTAAAHRAQFPEYEGWRLRVAPWTEAITGQARGVANLLLAAGAVVLLIACANLTSLLLARLNARRREMAVRVALGAAGWQVVRLLFIESLLVALGAGALGLVAAKAALGPVLTLLPSDIATLGLAAEINLRVVLYCAGIAVAAAVVTTLVPAWQVRRANPQGALKEGGAAIGGARQRARRVLVVAETAFAVVLLVGAGLLLRSFVRIQQIDPGVNADSVLTMRLSLAWERYSAPGATTRFFNDLVERLEALPEVSAVAAASQFPPQQPFTMQFRVLGAPAPTETLPNALVTLATPRLFQVLDMPLRHGRALRPSDRENAPGVVVVNEAFMKRYLNGRPEGRLAIGAKGLPVDVVGVVADARNNGLLRPATPEMFVSIDQAGAGNNQFFLLLRTKGDPLSALPSVRRTLAAMDPDQPLYAIQTMERAMAGSVYPQRVALTLVGVFAAGALIVAAIGVYGIVAFWVSARTREIGIRMALGASARQVTRLILGQTSRLVAVGLGLGLAGGVALGQAAESLLYDTSAADPVTLGGVAALLAAAGFVASYLPSRRAMAVDPVTVLRNE
jgi:putative ABC transport system permease protein